MKITEEQRGDVLVVRPEGRIDTNTSEELERALAGRIDAGSRRLVVDMGGTDYISSAGLRVLLLTAKKLKGAAGQLVLGGMNPSVRQIFELAGFLSIFAVEADVDRAVARATGAPGGTRA
jgi:anti-anti-sigma factor